MVTIAQSTTLTPAQSTIPCWHTTLCHATQPLIADWSDSLQHTLLHGELWAFPPGPPCWPQTQRCCQGLNCSTPRLSWQSILHGSRRRCCSLQQCLPTATSVLRLTTCSRQQTARCVRCQLCRAPGYCECNSLCLAWSLAYWSSSGQRCQQLVGLTC